MSRSITCQIRGHARDVKKVKPLANVPGIPTAGRHELLSVRLLESLPVPLPVPEELYDLLLHLVASHHGYCRPFAPVVEDATPVSVRLDLKGKKYSSNSQTALERLDSGVAERFWRLTRQYGWWGLAWLEAILRLADHRRSEWEEHRGGSQKEVSNG